MNELHFEKDQFNLSRFIEPQNYIYEQALSEIRNGKKVSHWMWFIFPQIDGLGFSYRTKLFAIKDIREARAYLDHPILGTRLLECAAAALGVEDRTALEIFGAIDEVKLKSCATLFAAVSPEGPVFHRLLNKYFQGEGDVRTIELLGGATRR